MSVTANSSTAPAASSTVASATESEAGGPAIRVAMPVSSRPPSAVQNAPGAAQSAVGGSDTVTAPDPSGCTRKLRCARSWSTRRMFRALPPSTSSALRIARLFMPCGAALNTNSSVNDVPPSCSAGTWSNRAVSGAGGSAGGAAAMDSASPPESVRPSPVQSVPGVSHVPPGFRMRPTLAAPEGAMVSSQRSLRPSTARTALSVPPLTVKVLSRMSSAVLLTASLSARRTVKAVSPSWLEGASSNAAVNGVASVAVAVPPGVTVTSVAVPTLLAPFRACTWNV